MAAPVNATDHFDSQTPVALFQTHRRQPISSQDVFSYDAGKDGKQFLIADKSVKAETTPPSIYLNWAREMEKEIESDTLYSLVNSSCGGTIPTNHRHAVVTRDISRATGLIIPL